MMAWIRVRVWMKYYHIGDVVNIAYFIVGGSTVCGTNGRTRCGFKPGKDNGMNELTYTRAGDYYLPDVALTDAPCAPPLGRYGMMHKEYLRKEKPALYAELLLTERLYPLCREVEEAAAHRLATIPDKDTAHEIILSELVYY